MTGVENCSNPTAELYRPLSEYSQNARVEALGGVGDDS